jgi:Integrase core domain
MQAELVVDALEMAISRRQPAGELIHHSDQGSQCVALIFGQKLRKAWIAQSMGSKGDCFDNAVCESFHATLEKELLRGRSFKTRQEANTTIFDWIGPGTTRRGGTPDSDTAHPTSTNKPKTRCRRKRQTSITERKSRKPLDHLTTTCPRRGASTRADASGRFRRCRRCSHTGSSSRPARRATPSS